MRYKLVLEYKGTEFCGWQRQKDARSAQEELECILEVLFKEKITAFAAGRTDSGVHATGQVVHFDTKNIANFNEFRIQEALNFHLRAKSICVLNVQKVDQNFDARFCAKKRYYEYKIINRRAPLTFQKNLYWQVYKKLDVSLMQRHAQFLVGRHDFNSFRSTECQAKNSVRTMESIKINHDQDHIIFNFCAKSYLHNQIRIIVGTLTEIGVGKHIDIKNALRQKNRQSAGPTAPACGLYFIRVDY